MFGNRLSANKSRNKSSSRPQQRSKNGTLRRGTTLAVRCVNALESRDESPLEIRDNVVDHPHDALHGDSSRITHKDVTTDKCTSLEPHDVLRSYPPPVVFTSLFAQSHIF